MEYSKSIAINTILYDVIFGTYINDVQTEYTHRLNYYMFNILIYQTSNQITVYSELNGDFFKDLSMHKHKLFIIGEYDNNLKSFKPTNIMYASAPRRMGLFTKKHILKAFSEKGIKLSLNKNVNTPNQENTIFCIN